MPKGTKTLGNNKARAWESLGLEHKKRGCAYFDTPSFSCAHRYVQAAISFYITMVQHQSTTNASSSFEIRLF